jgi:hypothetical protein
MWRNDRDYTWVQNLPRSQLAIELLVIDSACLSIDENADLAKQAIASRGLTNLEPYWSASDGSRGWESPAAKAYGISGVPATVLVDREGRILWRGHPLENLGGQDLAARLEAAFKK